MVKKLVLDLCSTSETHQDTHTEDTVAQLHVFNQTLHEMVTQYKDKITEYYRNKTWDKYKKLSNEYEMIFTSPSASSNITTFNPVSRSFFKLWEVLQDFEKEVLRPHPMKAVFLAEGPGGFTEAFLHKRQGIADTCYGITLRSNYNKNIPDWKIPNLHQLKLCYGKDGTGNLYSLANIEHFVETVGAGTVDFITADGGFDFSSDFNNQEELSYRLILCETLCALLLQRTGGSFLLKIYDCFNEHTIKLIHVLQRFYEHVHFIKPLTSRPANSERYLLCTGYRVEKEKEWYEMVEYMKIVVDLYEHNAPMFEHIPYDTHTLHHIVLYNFYYTMRQVYYIQRTINYINFFRANNHEIVMQALLEKHANKSKKWCQKYNIPYR